MPELIQDAGNGWMITRGTDGVDKDRYRVRPLPESGNPSEGKPNGYYNTLQEARVAIGKDDPARFQATATDEGTGDSLTRTVNIVVEKGESGRTEWYVMRVDDPDGSEIYESESVARKRARDLYGYSRIGTLAEFESEAEANE